MSSLSPSDDVYTASAGDNHTANFTAPSPYTSVKWYVKSPTDTSERGTLVETDTGDGSTTTASLSYTFASTASAGAYIITAYVTTSSGVYEVSYTVTIPTVPDAPTFRMVLIQGNTQILIRWNKPVSDGGSAITEYQYRYQLSTATQKGVWRSAGLERSKTVSGLTSGASYTIELRAKNSAGYSVASTPWSFTMPIPRTVPSKPLALSATAGDGSVDLSWQPPASDGNSSILRYEYRYGIGASVTVDNYTKWKQMGSAMATYPVSPLTNDMSHIFEVRAVNAIGAGPPSDADTATPTRPRIPPGAPTSLTATAGNGRVFLSWTAPTDLGSATVITDYEYRRDINNDDSWNSWGTTGDTNTTE